MTLVLSPQEWEQILAVHACDEDSLWLLFMETFGADAFGEPYVVCWEGDLHRSVREQRPPVPGRWDPPGASHGDWTAEGPQR